MIEPREMIRTEGLEGVPHAFLTGIGHEGAPDPALLVPGGKLVVVKQVHSSTALIVDGPFPAEALPAADALVTSTPGLVLGVVTADCGPVLLADRQAGVIGAAHAGWRGAHFGVLEAVVRRMEEAGANRANIVATLGPTIAQDNYEVGFDFYDQFEDRHQSFFKRGKPGKWLFDLPGYIVWRLESLKLGNVHALGIDTYADETRFHSYRRATHRGEPSDGRNWSIIALG